jgi:hypothetical protein
MPRVPSRRTQAIWTRFSREQPGHLTSVFSSSSNQERPQSQRIRYMSCAVAELNSSSCTRMPSDSGGVTREWDRRVRTVPKGGLCSFTMGLAVSVVLRFLFE